MIKYRSVKSYLKLKISKKKNNNIRLRTEMLPLHNFFVSCFFLPIFLFPHSIRNHSPPNSEVSCAVAFHCKEIDRSIWIVIRLFMLQTMEMWIRMNTNSLVEIVCTRKLRDTESRYITLYGEFIKWPLTILKCQTLYKIHLRMLTGNYSWLYKIIRFLLLLGRFYA